MGTWKAKWPVEYSAASDENIDSWVQKYIAEIDRIYQLLHRVRVQDAAAGEPEDTVPYQWHFETLTNTLFIRNPAMRIRRGSCMTVWCRMRAGWSRSRWGRRRLRLRG